VILELWENAADWKAAVKNGKRTLIESTPNTDAYVYRWFSRTAMLPWELVDMGIKRSLLEREYERVFVEEQ
jgi:hypothetical protein